MKQLIIISGLLTLMACTAVPEPRVALGKKCIAKGEQVTYSYVWVYDRKTGLPANTVDCDLIDKK
jgi:hypothetical protein